MNIKVLKKVEAILDLTEGLIIDALTVGMVPDTIDPYEMVIATVDMLANEAMLNKVNEVKSEASNVIPFKKN